MGNVAFVCAVLTRGSSFQETPWRSIDGSFGEEGVSDEGVGPVQVLSITSREAASPVLHSSLLFDVIDHIIVIDGDTLFYMSTNVDSLTRDRRCQVGVRGQRGVDLSHLFFYHWLACRNCGTRDPALMEKGSVENGVQPPVLS
ncbi:hypothetical protein GW17_00028391 [Ensete ventricosum]|nr:hypothetical protein GW17_00028391 [Ensete ventricosum]RZR94309.1 hypothetical protein BHM03_00022983 [Ensete ventricosum]